MVTSSHDQEPHWYKRNHQPAHNTPKNAKAFHVVQASSVFLLLFPLKLGAVLLHVASFPAEITLATEATLCSHSTKLQRSIPTVLTVGILPPLLMLWLLWHRRKRSLPRARKPHGTVSTVGKLHCGTEHNRPKVLVVLSYRCQLVQVE